MPAKREYGARLKAFRKARNVQSQALAAALGKSKSWVSAVEDGEIRLFYETTVEIGRFFGTHPDAIFLPDQSTSEAAAL
jgi:transcriptional regulator with XRE-family HTH domain